MRTGVLERIALLALLSVTACSGAGGSTDRVGLPTLPATKPGFTVGMAPATISEFPIASGDSGPTAIAVAGDGNAWFLSANAFNRITVAGNVTPHADRHLAAYNSGTDIILGPDGAMWFTANCAGNFAPPDPFICDSFAVQLMRTTLSGSLTVVAGAGDTSEGVFQSGLASGPNNTISAIVGEGATVATNGSAYEVVKLDGTRVLREELPKPCADVPGAGTSSVAFYSASGIARGSDGAFYIAAAPPCAGIVGAPPNAVLRINSSGAVTNTFLVPDAVRIAAGPDGNLWITQGGATNAIARMTTSGAITEFRIPTANAGPLGITAGNDGAIWFAESSAGKIGRITTSGVITEYATPTANSGPWGVASLPGACGPGHGQIWFTESRANKIGRIDF